MKTSLLVAAGALALATSAVPASAQSNAPTFYKDVLPILQKNCQSCHRPGEVAPMSLLTYEDARPWAKSIKTKPSAKQMPPWFADAELRATSRTNARLSDARHRDARRVGRRRRAGRRPERRARADDISRTAGTSSLTSSSRCRSRSSFRLTGTINYKYILVKANFKKTCGSSPPRCVRATPKVLHHGKVWVRPPGSTLDGGRRAGEAYESETQRDIIGKQFAGRRQRHPRQVQSRARRAALRSWRARRSSSPRDRISSSRCTTRPPARRRRMCRSSGSCSRRSRRRSATISTPDRRPRIWSIPAGDGNAEVVSEVTLDEEAEAGLRAAAHASARQGFRAARDLSDQRKRDRAQGRLGTSNGRWAISSPSRSPLPKGTKLLFISALRQLARQPLQPGSDEEGRLGSSELGRDEQLLHRRPVHRDIDVAKAFLRSGASTLPRGESGPTLSMAEHAAGKVAPAFNAVGRHVREAGQGQGSDWSSVNAVTGNCSVERPSAASLVKAGHGPIASCRGGSDGVGVNT